jgi:ACS family tartrate transporter-like MFS transporter
VSRRLLPFLFLLYILSFLDRVNVGFAALEMNRDLGFGPTVYGWGAGIFFLGYGLFEVPSNLVLYRTGARIWIARIMVTWGLAACAMMLVRTPFSFYLLRFLLGVAEAGFFPGIIFYLTHWYPARERARAYSWFLAAIPVSGIIGGPLSGSLLGLDGVLGLRGWQWLFLMEGLPTVVVGFLVLFLLPDRPKDARWLAPAEKAWLEGTLEAERGAVEEHGASFRRAVVNLRVWLLALVYFLGIVGLYALTLWMPQVLKGTGRFTNFQVGLVTVIPYLVAVIGMVLVGASSDRTGERHFHIIVPLLVAAAGLTAVGFVGAPVPLVAALSIAAFGVLAWTAPCWALPTAFLKGEAGAGGIALINSCGALGGFVGPLILGLVKDRTGSFTWGLLIVAGACVAAAGVVEGMRRGDRVMRGA